MSPPVDPLSLLPLERVLETIVAEGDYHEITELDHNGPRKVFKARFGEQGTREDIIKIDADEVESPQAQLHNARGCNTHRDIQIRQKLGAHPNLPVLYSVRTIGGRQVSIEEKVQGVTLEEHIQKVRKKARTRSRAFWKKNGVLTRKQIRKIFEPLLRVIEHQQERGIYHRDISPKNIMITPEGHVKVVDYANAIEGEELTPGLLPTAGARKISDPSLYARFTGEPGKFDLGSELYSVGINLTCTAKGECPLIIDPHEGILARADTNESLLDEQGLVDVEKYEAYIQEVTEKFPRKHKYLGRVVRKLLTLDREERYENASKAREDIHSATIATPLEYLLDYENTDSILRGFTVATMAGILLLGGYSIHSMIVKGLEKELFIKGKYKVEVDYVGGGQRKDGPAIENNLIVPEIYLSPTRIGSGDSEKFFYIEGRELPTHNVSKGYLILERGEDIYFSIQARELIKNPNGDFKISQGIKAQVYLEGFEPKKFLPMIKMKSEAVRRVWHPGGWRHDTGEYEIPEDLPSGAYTFAIEFLAPENEIELDDLYFGEYDEDDSESVIFRRRVPVFYDTDARIWLHEFYSENNSFNFFDKESGIVNLQGYGLDLINSEGEVFPFREDQEKFRFGRGTIYLEEVPMVGNNTLMIKSYKEGEPCGFSFLPISRTEMVMAGRVYLPSEDDYYLWTPDKDWPYQLIEMRKQHAFTLESLQEEN